MESDLAFTAYYAFTPGGQQPGFLGTSLPSEYGYAIVVAAIMIIAATALPPQKLGWERGEANRRFSFVIDRGFFVFSKAELNLLPSEIVLIVAERVPRI